MHFLAVIGHLANNKFKSANQATNNASMATETFLYDGNFHCMLTFNFMYNVMVNYMFLEYEYVFPRFKFAHKVFSRTTCQLIIYKSVGSNVSVFAISLLLPFLTIWSTLHRYFGTCISSILQISASSQSATYQFLKIQITRTSLQNMTFLKPIIEEDSAYRVFKY